MLSLFFKILQNPKCLRRDYVRGFESKLFHVSITQDSLVDTLKFINPGEAGNNLYADSLDKEDEPLSAFTRGRAKDQVWGSCWYPLSYNYKHHFNK